MRALPSCSALVLLTLGIFTSVGAAAETNQRVPLVRSRDVATSASREPSVWQPRTMRKLGSAGAVAVGVLVLWVALQRGGTRKTGGHPLLESLGSIQVTPKVRLHVVRLGKRLLLLHITGSGRVERIAELTDPEEVGQFVQVPAEAPPADKGRVDELLRQLGEKDFSRSSLV